MRIIAGSLKGKRLFTPASKDIRPTSDRLRETVFNLLHHGRARPEHAPHITGGIVLDLCCGTGAMGLEALSQGAATVCFVDYDANALELTRKNIAHLGVEAKSSLLRADVAKLPEAPGRFEIVFLDPPYAASILEPCLQRLIQSNWLTPHALLFIESANPALFKLPAEFRLLDQRKCGTAMLTIAQYVQS